MRIALIDNYDSFTFNLVHYIKNAGARVDVFRNDALTIEELEEMAPHAIVISPGPGRPEDAGISLDVVRQLSGKFPLLGVCLGHQSIAQAFGGTIIQAKKIMHGKTSRVTAIPQGVFKGMDQPFTVMRYHSLAVQESDFPPCLQVTARTEDGEIMGLCHREHPTQGVQFHPESFMTSIGKELIKNFVQGIQS